MSFDQFWAQNARQHQQHQGLDIVEVVRHVVAGVLAASSNAPQWAQHQNNAQGYAGQFGQQNYGPFNQGQQGWNGQQQGQDIDNLLRAIIPAVLNNARSGQQQFGGQQSFNANGGFNPFNNAQQGYDQLRQQLFNNGLNNGLGFNQNNAFGQQGFNGFQQNNDAHNHVNNLARAILPAVLNAVAQSQQGGNNQSWNNQQQPWNNQQGWGQQGWNNQQPWNNQQQGGYQQFGADQNNAGNNNAFGNAQNAFGNNQNAFDQQQQQLLRGVDLSLLIRAIVPDIAKAVVPVVLNNLSGQQQQARHVG